MIATMISERPCTDSTMGKKKIADARPSLRMSGMADLDTKEIANLLSQVRFELVEIEAILTRAAELGVTTISTNGSTQLQRGLAADGEGHCVAAESSTRTTLIPGDVPDNRIEATSALSASGSLK